MTKAGVHYTPEYIADFIVNKVNKYIINKNPVILEPCVGEGVFISALHKNLGRDIKPIIHAVEINKGACSTIRSIFSTKDLHRVNNIDYLEFNSKKRYDLIIGNPPYVNKKHMTMRQVKLCASLVPNDDDLFASLKLINLWTAFIIKSCNLLSERGVVAFLLPSDLAHVHHASPVKKYLLKNFCRIELYEFDKVVFEDAEQNAILLIAVKYQKNIQSGMFCSRVKVKNKKVEASSIKRFNTLIPDKWTNYGLSKKEIDFLRDLQNNLLSVGDYCHSSAGIVTAANNYFILTDKDVTKYGLRGYATPIIQKAAYVNGSVSFNERDWNELKMSNKPCYLLDFSKRSNLSSKANNYLSMGILDGIDKRYKCINRDSWYKVPNIKTSEGFFFKRSHLYPKLIKNDANISVTDTAYTIAILNGYELNSLIYSFYNSLSLVFSEITGRQYAGGVLELTPSEFRNIPLPYLSIGKSDFKGFEKEFTRKEQISDVLKQNNKVLLYEGLGLKRKDILLIDYILQKLTINRFKLK